MLSVCSVVGTLVVSVVLCWSGWCAVEGVCDGAMLVSLWYCVRLGGVLSGCCVLTTVEVSM